jgi:hypothetical protein
MPEKLNSATAVIGIDIDKNSFHVVGLDQRGAIVLRQKWSRGQVQTRFANMPALPDRDGGLRRGTSSQSPRWSNTSTVTIRTRIRVIVNGAPLLCAP